MLRKLISGCSDDAGARTRLSKRIRIEAVAVRLVSWLGAAVSSEQIASGWARRRLVKVL